jgi:hypothetical protein
VRQCQLFLSKPSRIDPNLALTVVSLWHPDDFRRLTALLIHQYFGDPDQEYHLLVRIVTKSGQYHLCKYTSCLIVGGDKMPKYVLVGMFPLNWTTWINPHEE